jgi:glycosyltransferase involved in cell wall biosynthesis
MDQHGEVETLGTVLMEAMACGVPVIGTRLGGIPDVIENQVSGILVEPKNSEELAQTILQVLKRPKFCEKLSKGGLQRVRSAFSWDIAVQATLKSYQGLLKNDIRV